MKRLGIIRSYSDRPTTMPPKNKGKSIAQIQDECLFYLHILERQEVCSVCSLIKTKLKDSPDFILSLKGKFVAVEIKRQRGSSEELIEMRNKIIKSGGQYLVIRSVEELQLNIRSILTI